MKNKKLKIAGLLLAMVCATQAGFAVDVSTYNEFNSAVNSNQTPIQMTQNITGANRNLYSILGNVTAPTIINGSNYSISGTNGNNRYSGFTIGSTNSLVLNNVDVSGFTTAINNSGTLTLNNVTLAAASTGANNTFSQANTGSTILTGTNNINSNITGTGNINNQGSLTTSGNNSGYTGTYEQSTSGSATTVTGTFFGGTSNISNGTLNWNTSTAIPNNSILVMTGANTTLNVGADSSQNATLAINSGSSIAEAVSINVRENSQLNVAGAGVVDLNGNDSIDGTLNLSTGTVNVNNGAVAGTLNATGGNLNLNGGTFIVNNKSKIENNTVVNIASGTLDVQGNVQLNGNDTWTGEVKLSGGDLTVSNRTEAQGNGVLKAETGNLTLDSGNLTVGSGSSVASAVNTNIKSNSILNITDGTVAIDTGDTWTGEVKLNGNGTLNYTGVNGTNGKLTASNGNLNVDTNALNIGSGSSIAGDVITKVTSTLNVLGGNVELNDNDTISGTVNLTSGELKLNNSTIAGVLDAQGGTLNLVDGVFVLNSNSTIADAVITKIAENKTLQVEGTAGLNNNDEWLGIVNLKQGGALTISGRDANKGNGQLVADGGILDIKSGYLTIGTGSDIASAVDTTITGNLNITDGTVAIDTGDVWTGNVNLNGTGSLDFNGTKDGTNGKLSASNGTLNVNAGTLNIVTGSSIGTNVNTSIVSVLNIAGGNVVLDNNDEWTGEVLLSSGNLTVNNIKPNGNLTATGGKLDISAGELTLGSSSSIGAAVETVIGTSSTLNVAGATVELGNNDTWSGNATVNVTDGILNVNITDNGGNGIITANGGSVNVQTGILNIGANSNIQKGADVTLGLNTTTNVSGGNLELGTGDNWQGQVNLSNGKLTLDGLTSNGVINATGGEVEIESGRLTIAGNSNIQGAQNVIIDNAGSLVLQKDTTVNNITGNGNLTLDGKILTFNNSSNLSSDIKFVSQNNSTVSIVSSSKADSVLDVVTKGTNTGLTLNINGSNATQDLNIDGTNISKLNFLNTVDYSGALTNNGTVANSGNLTLNGIITGNGVFNNSNIVTLNSDASGFGGTYTQSAGSTTVVSTGKVFGGEKNINGGSLNITSAEAIDYTNVKLGSNAQLNHTSQSADKNVVSDSVVKFTGSGATANFGTSTGVQGNYELATKIDNGNANKVVFNNSTVTLALQDYTGSTEYRLVNSDLNLVEKGEVAATQDYKFTNLTTDNATLSFNVEIVDGTTEGSKALKTDTLTITNGSDNNKFNFGNIYITGEENGNPDVYQTTKDVLTGAQFVGQPSDVEFATGATTSWVYDVKSANNGHSISMQITNYTDENTLYQMNATEGTRFFQFSDNGSTGTEIYHIDQSLSATAGQRDGIGSQANFSVSGHDRDKNIISGEIYDRTTHQTTGNRGSFFNIASGEDVKLDIKNLTIQDAQKTGNGSVVENNSEKAVITLNNVGVKNNEATGNGGAIYNGVMPDPATNVDGTQKANLIITNSILNNNTAGGNGGAIYNAGNMAVTGTTFTDNAAAQGGAIWNSGNMILTNVTVSAGTASAANDIYQAASGTTVLTGTNTIASNISGEGSIANNGTLNISGDNSGYTGTFTQDNNGSTTVTNQFFAGESTIKNGTLNWYTENDIDTNAKLTVETGKLNIGKDANQNSVLSIGNGSSIADVVQLTINDKSALNVIADGTVTLNANDSWKGLVNVENGKLTISDFKKSHGAVTAIGGEVEIINSNLTIAENDKILNAVTTTIDEKSLVNIAGGNVELNAGDTWAGHVNISSGDLTIDNVASNGIITASGGNITLENGNLVIENSSVITEAATVVLKDGTTTTVQNSAANSGLALNTGDTWAGTINVKDGGLLTINNIENNNKLLADGGTVNLIAGPLVIENGSEIKNAVATTIGKDAVLNIKTDGKVELNGANDSWLGEIKITDGQLDLDGMKSNNKLTATDGGTINLKTGNLDITKGSIIAGNNDAGNSTSINIAKGSNLNILGGDVTINENDTWEGFINLKSGTLNIEETTEGILHADGGNLNFTTGTLTIKDGSYIDLDVVVDLPENSLIEILKGGTVAINDNDIWDGEVFLNGGVLNYGTTHSGTLTATEGDMNLLSGSILNIQIPSQVADEVNVDIQKGALVNLKEDAIFNLDSKDKWNGMINNAGGKLTTTNLTNSTGEGGGLQQTAGSSTFQNNSHIFISDANSYITGGDVNILNNSSLWMGAATAELNVDNLQLAQNSTLNMMNDKINTANAGNMIVNDRNNVTINISPRDWQHDKFIINNIKSDSEGTINISDFDFLGLCPIDRHLTLQIFDAKNISNVNFDATDKQIFTPIGWYDLRAAGGGYYTSNLTKYNPQVFRGQVATMAMWNNQLAIDDMLLNHVTLSSERLLAQGRNANSYAISESQFAPYQYRKEDGGLWFKSYVNFETLSMTQGLNVHNNAYGSIVGADFPVMNLKNGWKFMPTAYIGYNGSHQSFNRVSMYQNGGQGGFMGTFMKNDFVGSVLAYGGGYNNEMSVEGATDRTGNWFAGTAAKAAYNLHATKHLTVQPTMMLAYNIFGRQNWGTDFGTMSMGSGHLNGINVAPGVNLIYARETWNLYATFQYMYNINDHVDGKAGNVRLSNVDMRHGYFQYGFGANKTWKDRLTSYFQLVFRNGGRTGVGFQLGAQYLFDWFKPSKKIEKVQNEPQQKIQIKSLSMK